MFNLFHGRGTQSQTGQAPRQLQGKKCEACLGSLFWKHRNTAVSVYSPGIPAKGTEVRSYVDAEDCPNFDHNVYFALTLNRID